MRSIRFAFADASLCIDMEAWQQQFFRKVEQLNVMKNKTFPSAPIGSPKALRALFAPFMNGFAWSLRCRASFKKGREAATLSKWFTGPEICFGLSDHTLAFAAEKIQ
ncbi:MULTISPECIES: hypothetical protein [Agrobacterium tumefaciens complex]|uniref:hypothetical protein n=1 Tax=Agrobacterium tumefaciens complex TaxID=1183400 RepID=UPI00055626F6|nr:MULTISPECIES: hypothetical protein [Agrobacterium tumefaciens complex]